MPKVLVLLYDGYSEMELSFPAASFSLMEGIEYELVGIDKLEVVGWAGIKTVAEKLLKDVNPSNYDILFIPGVSPFYFDDLMANQTIIDLIKKMNAEKKLIVTVCLTPLLVGEAGLLKGKRVCSDAPAEQYEKYEVKEVSEAPVVRDGNLIFAKGPAVIWLTKVMYEAVGLNDTASDLIEFIKSEGGVVYSNEYELP